MTGSKPPEVFPPPGYIRAASSLEGIEVYIPAPVESAVEKGEHEFKCPQCGATISFNPAEGKLACLNCGYSEEIQRSTAGRLAQEFEFTPAVLEKPAQGMAERIDQACQACGALTSMPATLISHSCPFCGSNNVYQRGSAQDSLLPKYLVPFAVSQQKCSDICASWIGSSWMTPSSLKGKTAGRYFSAIYLPFWIFDAVTRAAWKAEVGHDRMERYYQDGEWKTRTVTDWRWESGSVSLQIDDLIVPGSGKVSRKLIEQVQDYRLGDLVEFEAKFLAGIFAHMVDIPLEKAWESGRQQMREKTKSACHAQATTSKVRNFSMNLDFGSESWRYILLPAYLSTYRHASKSYTLMVNGQTGAIAGQRPVDWQRVWLVVAALLAPGVMLGLLGLLTLAVAGIGVVIGGFGFVLFVIGLVASLVILVQANKLDDI